MKIDIKRILILCMVYFPVLVWAQGAAVVNSRTGHASAVLDLSNNTNNKVFLPPRVELTTLTNITNPIANPADGLIVYNIGTTQLKGYYIFENNIWSLMATRENSVMNAIFEKNTPAIVALTTSFITLTGLAELDNNSGNDISLAADDITLQPGKYVVNVALNISTAEANSGSIGNAAGRTQAHYYTGRLWDGSVAFGGEVQLNEISNTLGDKKHAPIFTFSFELTAVKTVHFELARRAGGTYAGNINVNNIFVQIEKSIP